MSGKQVDRSAGVALTFISEFNPFKPRPWWMFWRPQTSPYSSCCVDVLRDSQNGNFIVTLKIGTEFVKFKDYTFRGIALAYNKAIDVQTLRTFAQDLLKLLDESETKSA